MKTARWVERDAIKNIEREEQKQGNYSVLVSLTMDKKQQ